MNNDNIITLTGAIVSDLQFSHESYNEKFYVFYLSVSRLSGQTDVLPITISEKIVFDLDLSFGKIICIYGEIRTYNQYDETAKRSKLVLTVFVHNCIDVLSGSENNVHLCGYVCKPPSYRTTPFGREITDVHLAVNRQHGKADYIPCITWGRNAKYCSRLDVGDNIILWGRLQSREYQKKYDDGTVVDKVTYEVSVSRMELIDNQPSGK